MARERAILTDEQWARLAPLLPPEKPATGRPAKPHREVVEAIGWVLRTGAAWRDLPPEYGPWQTAASRFYRWGERGVWDRVLAALQADADARGDLDWLLHYLDGSVVRAHQHAAGAKGGTRPPRRSGAVAAGSARRST
jgi:transposase